MVLRLRPRVCHVADMSGIGAHNRAECIVRKTFGNTLCIATPDAIAEAVQSAVPFLRIIADMGDGSKKHRPEDRLICYRAGDKLREPLLLREAAIQ